MATASQSAEPLSGLRRNPKGGLLPVRDIVGRYGTIIFVLVVLAYFSLDSDGTFLAIGNFKNVAVAIAPLAIVAGGLTLCLVMGDFDLSIANNAVFAGVVAATVGIETQSVALAFVAGVGSAALVGLFNGIVVTVLNVNAFIATLASGLFILQGLGFVISETGTVSSGLPTNFNYLGNASFLGLRLIIWIAAAVLIVLWVVLQQTEVGRRMDAVGGNPSAARLAGISLRRTRILGFVISGTCAGIAGVLIASQFNLANATGQGTLLLDAFTAAFVGSATLSLGRFHILGTVFGAAVLGLMTNGMTLTSVPTDYQNIYKGLILIGAVAFASLVSAKGRTP